MIQEMEDLLPDFAGNASHIRCFLHVVNLVAKSLLKQFDLPKAVASSKRVDDALKKLDEGLEFEEMVTLADCDNRNEDDEDDNVEWLDNNMKGYVDEMALLDNEDCSRLKEQVRPIQYILMKVHSITSNSCVNDFC
jgi:hypothetical protein